MYISSSNTFWLSLNQRFSLVTTSLKSNFDAYHKYPIINLQLYPHPGPDLGNVKQILVSVLLLRPGLASDIWCKVSTILARLTLAGYYFITRSGLY